MGRISFKNNRKDSARASSRSIIIMIAVTVLVFVGSYAADGGFARFSGIPTVKADLSVTYSGLLTSNEKFSVAVSNLTGNLSLSNVKVSIRDNYGDSVSGTLGRGSTTDPVTEGEANGVIMEYVYDISASGGGLYLTNNTIITITVTDGAPSPVSSISLVDTLSDGTIGTWSH